MKLPKCRQFRLKFRPRVFIKSFGIMIPHLFLQRLDAFEEWVANWSLIGARKNLPIVCGWLQAIGALKVLINETLSVSYTHLTLPTILLV